MKSNLEVVLVHLILKTIQYASVVYMQHTYRHYISFRCTNNQSESDSLWHRIQTRKLVENLSCGFFDLLIFAASVLLFYYLILM